MTFDYVEILAILTVALIFDFANGMQGSANVVATIVSSGVLHPRRALWLAALAEGVGPFLFGAAVASTIGEEFIDASRITPLTLFAGILGATIWTVITVRSGIPISASHALIGGLIGASIAQSGFDVLQSKGLVKIALALFLSPFIGMMCGFLLVRVIYILAYHANPRINTWFKRGQLVASCVLALAFGSNDGQKVMGVIVLGLVLTGHTNSFAIPAWVILVTALVLAMGTLVGGTRLIRTMSSRFYKIRPVHGLSAQSASAGVILIAGFLGGPVSTTQIVSSSIIGAGSADRLSKVRWQVFDRIVMAWLLTIPTAAITAAVILVVLKQIVALG